MQLPSRTTEDDFITAYDDYADAIFRHCYFRVFDRERGKELMQETFIRAWKYVCDGHTVDNMRAFLYRIANNLIIDEVRKKKEYSLEELQQKGLEPSYDATEELGRRVDEHSVLALLKDVEKIYRDVLVLRYVNGLLPADIAQIMGESSNTVSVRLHRGIKQLKSMLKKGK